jgi:hypothetical protein
LLRVDTRLEEFAGGPAELRPQCPVDLRDGGAKDRAGTLDPLTHPGELRPVAGECEGKLALCDCGSSNDGAGCAAIEELGEHLRCCRRIVPERDDAVRVMIASARRRPQHGGQLLWGSLDEPGLPAADKFAQRRLGTSRDEERRRRRRRLPLRLLLRRRCEDDMRVGAAEAERAHPGARRGATRRNRLGLADKSQIQLPERDLRIRSLAMQSRRQGSPLQGERRLE